VTPFRELLDELGKIEGLDRVRFTSSNPHDMTPDILRAHFEIPNLCHFLHFALQSGSDSVLKRMNRKHTYADFKAQVEYLRSQDPLFGISTDIIVGFPGETEEEFQMTETAMRECEFDFAYIARYNTRNGTRAAEFPDMVSPEEKARRWDILNQILRESIVTRSQKMIGRVEEILITGTGRTGNWVGRTRNFKEVYIESSLNLLDSIVPIRITELDDLVLKGELL
jgi:tRNA-2-methylthio-N6-dimethylallyladenosine synthase